MSNGKAELIWVVLLLLVVTALPFAPVVQNDFINYDDNLYVTENVRIHGGLSWEGVRWAFTSMEFSNWFPLTWLSFMLDHELYGLNASGYHLTNLVLHLLNTLILFGVLWRMTGRVWQSWMVAALFGVHPLHVESVAWVAERKDVLSTFFGFLALWTYVRYVQTRNLLHYLLMVLCLVSSLMAKPMFVTFPFVLLVLDHWPLGRLPLGDARELGRRALEKLPLFVLVAASSAVTYIAQATGGAVQQLETLDLWTRVGNAFVSYASYLGKLFWPLDLAVLYPHVGEGLGAAEVVAAVVLLLAVSSGVVWRVRRQPYLLVGWLWYLGTLVPVIGIVQVGIQSLADRYTYVPLIGPFIMLSWALYELTADVRRRKLLMTAAAGVVISTLMVLTSIQVGRWRDSITLFQHTLQVTSNNFMAHNNLGFSLNQQGRSREAIPHFQKALAMRPDFGPAHNNLGVALDREGRLAEAIDHFERALEFDPGDAKLHNSLGISLGKQGRLEEAKTHFARALQIAPNFLDAHNNLGIALASQGRFAEAVAHFERALEIDPTATGIYENLRIALEMQRNSQTAPTD
jgi:Flp pilus assembly protein TadD